MRLAMIENLAEAEGYCHQKAYSRHAKRGDATAGRGITGVTAEEVFISGSVGGSSTSAWALLSEGDGVLMPG
jgi:hypothetical protein